MPNLRQASGTVTPSGSVADAGMGRFSPMPGRDCVRVDTLLLLSVVRFYATLSAPDRLCTTDYAGFHRVSRTGRHENRHPVHRMAMERLSWVMLPIARRTGYVSWRTLISIIPAACFTPSDTACSE